MSLIAPVVDRIVETAILEDMGWGDITTELLVPDSLQAHGSFLMKADGVLAGLEVAGLVFLKVDPSLVFTPLKRDGDRVKKGDVVATVRGSAAGILKAERTALNFLQRLSGTATLTAKFVEIVAGLKTRVSETRKTTPGLRYLEKYAVRVGGGINHRHHLGDGILIKDNHLVALYRAGLSLRDIIDKAKKNAPHTLKVEVEVTSIPDAVTAAEAGADIILLDNMSPEEMRKAVEAVAGRVKLEASGGINLENARVIAETGVDIISVGALTHSARALDISLELEYE
ncbi:MAG: carboxylating nicotinate-nucleotide diphosphorylase [Chloroflexi bacterium]|nr:carboxylating nicotinate-nucleotide diphosphorylase [Chloroflexota bacterium]